MSGVPYTFGTATTSIPLSNLDSNFVTPVTIGNASVALGNTISTIGNLTLNNVTINGGTINASVTGSYSLANAVVYSNSSNLGVTSANLTFDGTTLTSLNTAYTGTFTGGTGIVNLGSGQFYKDASGRVLVGLTSANASGSNFQVSQGITFPAIQSASSDANTLDDYEKGTWTPTNPQVSLSVTSAVYTKIGNTVYFECRVAWPANADTNQASITGFPFTPLVLDYPVVIFSNSGAGASGYIPGVTQLLIYTINQSAILTNAQLAGVTLRITGFYFV